MRQIIFPPVFKDLRSSVLKTKYKTIEQARADAWLDIATERKHKAQILKGQIGLLRRQAE